MRTLFRIVLVNVAHAAGRVLRGAGRGYEAFSSDPDGVVWVAAPEIAGYPFPDAPGVVITVNIDGTAGGPAIVKSLRRAAEAASTPFGGVGHFGYVLASNLAECREIETFLLERASDNH
jgi:hypothetical protein